MTITSCYPTQLFGGVCRHQYTNSPMMLALQCFDQTCHCCLNNLQLPWLSKSSQTIRMVWFRLRCCQAQCIGWNAHGEWAFCKQCMSLGQAASSGLLMLLAWQTGASNAGMAGAAAGLEHSSLQAAGSVPARSSRGSQRQNGSLPCAPPAGRQAAAVPCPPCGSS